MKMRRYWVIVLAYSGCFFDGDIKLRRAVAVSAFVQIVMEL